MSSGRVEVDSERETNPRQVPATEQFKIGRAARRHGTTEQCSI